MNTARALERMGGGEQKENIDSEAVNIVHNLQTLLNSDVDPQEAGHSLLRGTPPLNDFFCTFTCHLCLG